MASPTFHNLEQSVSELKKIYLRNGAFTNIPTPEDQEFSRAFAVLAHAEIEDFVETSFTSLADAAMRGVANGSFSRVAISMLTFSGLPPLTGGSHLKMPSGGPLPAGAKKEKTPRTLIGRYGEAHGRYAQLISKNHGIREKYLAPLGVPIGLDAKSIDPNWITDLSTFCDKRGAFAHHSRTYPEAPVNTVNPKDIWQLCERLIWTDQRLATAGIISSFEDLDSWVEAEKNLIGSAVFNEPTWRFRFFYALSMWWQFLKRRNSKASDEED